MTEAEKREMLELAAMAAGLDGEWGRESYVEQWEGFIPRGWLRRWNPLANDGDALRLAVGLRLDVVHSLSRVRCGVVQRKSSELVGDDRLAATRLAITRAAAEIGRQMQSAEGAGEVE